MNLSDIMQTQNWFKPEKHHKCIEYLEQKIYNSNATYSDKLDCYYINYSDGRNSELYHVNPETLDYTKVNLDT